MPKKLKWTTHADLAIHKVCNVGREEYLDHMTFQRNDRPLFTEIFGPIVGLKEEWEEQGASPGELDMSAFRYRCPDRGFVPAVTGRLGGFEPQLLEETDEYLLTRDEYGRTMRMFKGFSTLPLPLDHPVHDMDDWLRIKHWFEWSEERLAGDWADVARAHLAADRVVHLDVPGAFDEPRQLMGEAELCMAYYDQPEMIRDMLDTMGATVVRVLERVLSEVQVDTIFIHEDMAGKSGPLAGPRQVKEFLAPYYRRIWDAASNLGARLFDQDSDGDMRPVLDAFIDAGVNVMHPMEPAAGMDIVQIREQYGDRLAFYGGIDKHVIRRSQDEIVAELAYKIPPMLESGGCVLALDHRIPNGTPLDNYRFYVDKAWEIMER